MTTSSLANQHGACFNCQSTQLRTRFASVAGVYSGEYRIVQCQACAMAFIQTQVAEHVDYSDYGDHIASQDDSYYASRVAHVSAAKRLLFRYLEKRFGLGARILDFGCGAGFFMRSCHNHGFRNVCGVEPSLKLRGLAESKLKLDPSTLAGNIEELGQTFDVVSMLDVIEHLPVDAIDAILGTIVEHMRPGAVLLGTTPNLDSLNIRLFNEKDPVIAPPQHTVYFTPKSLHAYLRRHGLQKKFAFSAGLSTNSFFRSQKFSPSWVERPRRWQKPAAVLVRLIFAGAGVLLGIIGRGYGLYFVYQKPGLPRYRPPRDRALSSPDAHA